MCSSCTTTTWKFSTVGSTPTGATAYVVNMTEYAEAFVSGYIAAGLGTTYDWSDEETGGESLDVNYGPEDIAPEALESITKDCRDFIGANWRNLRPLLLDGKCVAEYAGYNFLMNRNHHGVGFWDRGYGPVGDELSDACHPYGESGFYVGDDGKVYV